MTRRVVQAVAGIALVLGSVVGLASPASAAPINDLPTAATVLTSANPTGAIGGNYRATDTDEPVGYGERKVWWSWTAPASGTVRVDTFGSSIDTVLGVWTAGPVFVTSNDDARSTLLSETSFTATSGTTYLFSVGSYTDKPSGFIALSVWFGDQPSIGTNTTSVTPVSLPASPTPPSCGGYTMGHAYRWFSWISGGTATFDTSGSTNDTVLFAYSSNQNAALTCLAANDDEGVLGGTGLQSRIQFSAPVGYRVYVLVGAFTPGDSTTITLHYNGADNSRLPSGPSQGIGTPSAPQNLAATVDETGVHLTWDPSASAGGGALREYVVYRASAGPAVEIGSTSSSTLTYDDSPGNGSWNYQVTAVNDAAESAAANVWIAPPDAPTDVIATRGDQSAHVSWTAPTEHGAPITSYIATSSPGGETCSVSGATECTVGSLTNGTQYSFTVAATSDIGSSFASVASAPVTPAGVPGGPTGVSAVAGELSAEVSWSASASNGDTVTGYTVTSSPDGKTCATTDALHCSVADLTAGTPYTFTVVATNGVGDSAPSAPSNQVTPAEPVPPDVVAPTVSVATVPRFTLAARVGVSFTGVDDVGIADYDVRYRLAPYSGGFGALVYPAGWQHTTAHTVSLTSLKGRTYCFSVRSRDTSGNVSSWSAQRCTAVALDDRSLSAATAGWKRATGSGYYAGTVTKTSAKKQVLARTNVEAKRIAVVVTKCHGCATIGVYWNGTLLKKIDLSSSTTKNKQLIAVAGFGVVKSGKLKIKTLTTGSSRIDGVAFSRV